MTARERAAARLLRWADHQEPAIKRAILDAWRDVQQFVDVRELTRRLVANDLDGVVDLLFSRSDTQQAEARVRATFARALQTTREQTIRTFLVRVAAPIADPILLRLVREWENGAFRRIREDVRLGIREQVASELARGVGPRQVAVALKAEIGRVGLTAYDERLINTFRRALEEGRTREALGRALRDRRYDPSLSGKALTPAQIERMVAAYRRKLVAFRAETHARTAALQAANDGQTAAWEDAVAQGRVPLEQVRRYWVVAEDERLCTRCAPIPGMNRQGVGLRESFTTPEGVRRSPVVHPNCRCTIFTRVVRPNVVPRPAPGRDVLILPQITERTRWIPQPA